MAKKSSAPKVQDFVVVNDVEEVPAGLEVGNIDRIDPNAYVAEQDVDEEKRRLQDAMAAEYQEEAAAATPAATAPIAPAIPTVDLAGLPPALAQVLGAILAAQQATTMAVVERLERLVEGQNAGSKAAAEALRRSKQPDNTHAPGISAFNPRGELEYPKPQLKCPMLLPWEAERDALTREEIELLNLLEPGEFTVRRIDGTKLSLTIQAAVQPNDRTKFSRLIINHETGFNNDNFRLMGPMTDWLRQILKQRPHTHTAAQKVLSMDEEQALVDGGQLLVSKGA